MRTTGLRAGGGNASPTGRLRARHRNRHHRERPRPAGGRRRHRRPRRPRATKRCSPARSRELLLDARRAPRRARARRARHLERRRLRPAVPRPTGPRSTGCRSVSASSHDPARSRCAGRRCPGHRGAYRASWYDHGHLDAYRLYRGDVGPGPPDLLLAEVDRPVRRAGAGRGRSHPHPRPLQRGAPRLRGQRRPPGPHPHRAPLGHRLTVHRPRRPRGRRTGGRAVRRGVDAVPA